MANVIAVYFNSPTAGCSDGSRASEGNAANPIPTEFLNTANSQVSANIKLAIRCDANYTTGPNSTITPNGTTANMWALALDSGGSAGNFAAYGVGITIAANIVDTNTLFWARAKAANTEQPQTDTSVDLVIAASVYPK